MAGAYGNNVWPPCSSTSGSSASNLFDDGNGVGKGSSESFDGVSESIDEELFLENVELMDIDHGREWAHTCRSNFLNNHSDDDKKPSYKRYLGLTTRTMHNQSSFPSRSKV